MTDLVDAAQRTTFQLTHTGSARLRRMTRASGLSSENVVSRVAIVRSLCEPAPIDVPVIEEVADGKEIRGATLLGRTRPAALLLAMLAKHAGRRLELDDVRKLVRFHWERGLALLAADCPDGNVTDWVAQRTLGVGAMSPDRPTPRPDENSRDAIAAAVGRRYGRWPLEVRRLAALAGRLDLAGANEAADRLAARAAELGIESRVSEAIALKVLTEWGLNRLGLTATDRSLLKTIASTDGLPCDELRPRYRSSEEFLLRLRLIQRTRNKLVITPLAKRMGQELWQP